MISRRDLLKMFATLGFGSFALSGYAVAEAFQENVTRYRLTPPRWTPELKLRLAVLADLHVCEPWMSIQRLEGIVEETNRLGADAILLLGDYVVGHSLGKYSTPVSAGTWATVLGKLKAPLGVHAVLGNHDWWDEASVQRRRAGPTRAGLALQAVGIAVYENNVMRFEKDGRPFWIAGLGDQWAFWPTDDEYDEFVRSGKVDYHGVDDLPGTLKQVTDDAPVILMAHEPDIFPNVPDRVSLTLAGHTHGGQIRIFGYAPVVPSRFGSRYVYGHKVEEGRHLIVSGGLGCSSLPIRFGAPPEIVVVDLGNGGEV
ncbi:MAG TPA: metallophosphoesterase [Hyphomicrobium sp.]|uniref:metallophosphoesterase n=1 Tax=Hyphomicrobium sp. TaxID=82 RepID=UPI002BF07D74|nr:metallophosphoesterase [Hyphomicrobium sp.]HXE02812.1 metallophosphoesterase [Hyphomicrobium sp.]